jgi:hypothetical protein
MLSKIKSKQVIKQEKQVVQELSAHDEILKMAQEQQPTLFVGR